MQVNSQGVNQTGLQDSRRERGTSAVVVGGKPCSADEMHSCQPRKMHVQEAGGGASGMFSSPVRIVLKAEPDNWI